MMEKTYFRPLDRFGLAAAGVERFLFLELDVEVGTVLALVVMEETVVCNNEVPVGEVTTGCDNVAVACCVCTILRILPNIPF